MKRSKLFWLPIVAVLVMFVVNAKAFADQTALNFYNQFNAMNSDQGFLFTLSKESGSGVHFRLTNDASEPVNVDAYYDDASRRGVGTVNYFTSFCVGPDIGAPTDRTLVGKLNYNVNNGQTVTIEKDNGQGYILSVGAAYLYMLYATGPNTNLFGLGFNASEFHQAINFLNGVPQTGTEWNIGSNRYLGQLESMKFGEAVWQEAYVVGKSYYMGPDNYDLGLGDYYVFVLNVQDLDGHIWQNYIYITTTSGPPEVPEPATMLLWSLGSLGMAGSWLRQRRMKKLAA